MSVAELNRQFPGRELQKAQTPEGLRDGWVAVLAAWETTVTNTSLELVDVHVEDEWSLAQTLRHLVLATDAWLRGAIMSMEQPLREIGQIFTVAAEAGFDMSIFRVDAPPFEEILAVRAERAPMPSRNEPPMTYGQGAHDPDGLHVTDPADDRCAVSRVHCHRIRPRVRSPIVDLPSAPGRGVQRGRRVGVGLVLLMGVAAGTTFAAGQAAPGELSIGSWRGHATAIGVTSAAAEGGVIVITGSFGASLDFTVPNQGPTTGRWALDGQTDWRLVFGETSGTALMSHSANGAMEGDRTRIGLGSSMITSTGSATVPPSGSFPIGSADPFGPLDLSVTARFCDDVHGEWIMSWNTLLSGASFSPSFRGNWQARRLADDGPSADRTLELMPELFELRDRLIGTWRDAESVGDVPILPIDTITDLLGDSVAIINELNNLSDCDEQYLGAENVQQWIYSFTTAVSLLSEALTLAVETATEGFAATAPASPPLTAPELLRWATVLAASGTIGPGSLDPAAPATLSQLTTNIETAGTAAASDRDRVTLAALEDQLGLDGG